MAAAYRFVDLDAADALREAEAARGHRSVAGRCDDGRRAAVLDRRHAFDVAAGAFEGALAGGLGKFSDFPAAWQDRCVFFGERDALSPSAATAAT